jgi:hypothetical protein
VSNSTAPPPRGGYSRGSLVELLAPALGTEQSEELVAAAAARLRLSSTRLEVRDALAIFDALSADKGIIGVSARFARARLTHQRETGRVRVSSVPPGDSTAGNGSASATPRTWPAAEVVALLAPSLGTERAAEVVNATIAQLKLSDPLQPREVVRLLDSLARSAGVVGAVSRFVKTRVMLAT